MFGGIQVLRESGWEHWTLSYFGLGYREVQQAGRYLASIVQLQHITSRDGKIVLDVSIHGSYRIVVLNFISLASKFLLLRHI